MSILATFRGDRQGSMSITMAGVLFLLAALSALFIDLGSMYLTHERLQGAVDSAALQAASHPDQAQSLAAEIISRNIPAGVTGITVEQGRYPPEGYTLDNISALPVAARFEPRADSGNAVRVSARARAPLYLAGLFGVTDGRVGASAIALNRPVTQIMASTQFADLSSLPADIPNALLTALTGTATALASADYRTLSDTSVDILRLLDALIAVTGLDQGDYEDVLAEPVTPAEILEAAATALASDETQGALAPQAVAVLADLKAQWAGLGALTLGALLDLDTSSPRAAAGARLDLFSLVLGAALTLNEQGGIIGHADLSVGGANTRLYVSVVSPPRFSAIGSEGIRVETAQVRLFLDTRLVNAITIPLLNVSADVRLPVYLVQGRGEAVVTDIDCPSSDTASAAVHVDATPGLISAEIGSVFPAALGGSLPPPVSAAGVVTITAGSIEISVTASAGTSISGTTRALTFTAPFARENFQAVPLASPADRMVVDLWGEVTPGVSAKGLTPQAATILLPQLASLVGAVVTPLAPLLDQTIADLQSLFSLDQGYMTVADTFLRCGRPLLAQ